MYVAENCWCYHNVSCYLIETFLTEHSFSTDICIQVNIKSSSIYSCYDYTYSTCDRKLTLILLNKKWLVFAISRSGTILTGEPLFEHCLYRGRLALILLERVISLTSVEPGQPAHLSSLTRLYTVGWLTSISHIDIPKMILECSKKGRLIIPFKEFSKLRVNFECHCSSWWLLNKANNVMINIDYNIDKSH